MIFGMFLTWETRNVTFPGLNESKYIGICVYNIFIISAVVLTVGWFALPTNVDTGFSVMATSIIFCTTSTLGLMFMPKVFSDFISFASLLHYINTTKNIINIFSVFIQGAKHADSTFKEQNTCADFGDQLFKA